MSQRVVVRLMINRAFAPLFMRKARDSGRTTPKEPLTKQELGRDLESKSSLGSWGV